MQSFGSHLRKVDVLDIRVSENVDKFGDYDLLF